MRIPALAGVVLAVLAPLWAGTAAPAEAAAESTCDGVWVIVDYGSLGGTQTACAARHASGAEALRSAGFSPSIENGFLLKINGKPGNPDPNKAYWSYWQASLTGDGGYTAWNYSALGATASHPKRGNAEGWRYQSLDDGKVPPGARPPDGTVSTPTPTPSETKASPKPTKKPSAKPSATRTPTASTSPTAKRTASRSATPTASASPTTTVAPTPAEATPTPDGSPTPVTAGPDDATPVTATTPAGPGSTGGSPVGAIAAGAAVVAAGAGLGGWWLLKGRKT